MQAQRLLELMRALGGACLVTLVAGCGDDSETTAISPSDCVSPRRSIGELCLDPGVQDDGCPAGTFGNAEGVCQPAGIPEGGCSAGFAHDGDVGCTPLLPGAPCAFGTMAVPGETRCRPVSACGAGTWGDIPLDGTTQHVDASYVGGLNDGSIQRPWTTIGEAVNAAQDGAVVAVAAGTYAEDVLIAYKTLHLWGVCPERVEIAGTGVEPVAMLIHHANGASVRGIAVSGNSFGVGVTGATDVVLEEIWIRNVAQWGLLVFTQLGPASCTLRRSLIEANAGYGAFTMAGSLTVEASVIRDTAPGPDATDGKGLGAQVECVMSGCNPLARATLAVRGSVIERNHDSGLWVNGSDATVEGSVIGDTMPVALDQNSGRGITVQCAPPGCDLTKPATLALGGSVVARNHEIGVFVHGSLATITRSVIRDTWPRASDMTHGRGLQVQITCADGGTACDYNARASANVRESVIEQAHDTALLVSGSDATLEGIVVRRALPQASSGLFGRAIHVQRGCTGPTCDPAAHSGVTIRGSRVDESYEMGILAVNSTVSVHGTWVNAIAPREGGMFGDGIAVVDESSGLAHVDVAASRIEASARAGISNFGGALALGTTAIVCSAFSLNGEHFGESRFAFQDLGQNACGCPEAQGHCVNVSAGLAPPDQPSP